MAATRIQRLLLLLPTTSYKAEPFVAAACALGVDLVVGTDRRQALERNAPGGTLTLDFARPRRGAAAIARYAAEHPLDAVVGADDETALVAALAGEMLGLRHNPAAAARATRDKAVLRRRIRDAGLRAPAFRRYAVAAGPARAVAATRYPCVLKPLHLSASRGVIRADGPRELRAAWRTIERLLARPEVSRLSGDGRHLLVEDYLPGEEVALEGLLERGRLRALALFDKPDPLEGPTFEETLYVTPSRHAPTVRRAILDEVAAGCRALGLREGPVHAELRLDRGTPWLIEIAARTIGGLCSRALRFGAGISLEELVLRHALGRDTRRLGRAPGASGVMMIPVPRAGVLRGASGLAAARAVPGVEGVTISVHRGARLERLPEGHRYLGFIFARAARAEQVETALRRAHAALRFDVDPGRRRQTGT